MRRVSQQDINTKEYWDKVWSDSGQQQEFGRMNMVIERIPENSLVLDVGCATGTFTRLLKRLNPTCKSVGIDISESGIEMARNESIEIPYYYIDVKNGIPFKDETFDIITAQEIIEHMEDPKSFLKETKRLLKKDGIFFGSVPFENSCPSQEHNWQFSEDEYNELLSEFFIENSFRYWDHAGNPKVTIISESKNKK